MDSINSAQETARNSPEFSLTKNNHHLLSDSGKHTLKVFDWYCKIIEVRDDLNRVEIFLRRFPDAKFYRQNEIDNLTYIKYHLEVFYHKIHTILDLLKLIANEVYELGLTRKKCTWENLKTKAEFKSTMSFKIIESFYKSFYNVIEARHLNTHYAIYEDSENDDLRSSFMVYDNSEKYGMEISQSFRLMFPKFILDYQFKKYKKDKIEFVKNGNKVASEYIDHFMNTILLEYKNRNEAKK